ncbi:zinc-binding dehydrogenase [Streptomyces sp. YS415]|uniref:zinc-binding dehydrogenase n=1 Tax=Streptomyces sp. YS415 TaxID=2944806 RepID=UPI0020210B40|nr:zinc-binding dehydrogenase [Streptomyces sp. YS415]MCL7425715.1 zinc-binding dehydrogenase [Streptomyces sp. YS415]
MSVRALVVDPSAPWAVRLGEVPEPVAGPGQVLVDVSHVSLNYGDLNDARSGRVPEGAVLGSDAAGVVAVAAADGSGPAAGARVVAMTPGAFAQRVAVDVAALAVVPGTLDPARAVGLPVAGIAALRSLRAAGLGPDKRVLVTGASGGVGRFAVQLAARAGAHVIASVGSAARGAGLAEAGADEVLVGLDGLDRPVDIVIDSVGGPQLVAAWNLLAPRGSLQSVGWTSGEPAVFPPYATVGPAKSLTSFVNEGAAGADLTELTELAAQGALGVEIGWQGSWERFTEAAEELRGRRIRGKAVLEVARA